MCVWGGVNRNYFAYTDHFTSKWEKMGKIAFKKCTTRDNIYGHFWESYQWYTFYMLEFGNYSKKKK